VFYQARNVRAGFRSYKLWGGLLRAAIEVGIFRGKAPWTYHNKKADNTYLKKIKDIKPKIYPKPDGVVTFDLMSSVYLSGTHHREGEPPHLILKNPEIATQVNYTQYGGPESFYCPAGVYEYETNKGLATLRINGANCIHCKTCDIKDPTQNILWTPPEGEGGPQYQGM
jgi:electron-transferring-flavoprotein dehydrogenase